MMSTIMFTTTTNISRRITTTFMTRLMTTLCKLREALATLSVAYRESGHKQGIRHEHSLLIRHFYFNSIHDHLTEDHRHEQHNFETHDASHSASSAHVDHGLSVSSGHAHGHAHGHSHGHAHGHVVADHGHR